MKPTDDAQDALATLLRSAGRRERPDADMSERAHDAAYAAWREALAERRRISPRWLIAAAVAVLAIGAGFFAVLQSEPALQVGVVLRATGDVLPPLADGATLRTDDRIETTSSGRALLRWGDGATLRVDTGTLVRVDSPQLVELVRGAVYVESASARAEGAELTVATPDGVVRHVGTRYEVRVTDGATRVRVRDGVAIFNGAAAAPLVVEAGRQLTVRQGTAAVDAGPALADPAWAWTEELAPAFAIEGRSLHDTLAWLSHETGLRIVYESPAIAAQAEKTVLHGSIDGLALRQAFDAVVAGSGLELDVHSDHIVIRGSALR